MQRDLIADLIYHIFFEEKKENPMPQAAQERLLDKVIATIKRLAASNQRKMEREPWNEKN